MIRQIQGTWALETFQIENLQNETRPWGQNISGLLIYTPSGHMSVSINKSIETKSEIEAQNILDSILFYSGTYSVEDKTVKHKVTQASNPSRIGKEMHRFAVLESDLLTLTSPQESFGKAILKWRKIT